MNRRHDAVIGFASEMARRYRISSIEPMLAACEAVARQHEISIAVVGRFKAGKSSFLNHFLRRNLLPVGVVPVTAVVTEISYGPREKAVVHFLDGRAEEIDAGTIRHFVAESENPGNKRQVSRVTIELTALDQLKGIRFVDMPGLESALAHNTEASLNWLPNVGLALVAVSADQPLSRQDLDLVESLQRYTPNISILLTKADLLSDDELAEVLSFIRGQLALAFGSPPQVFPCSVRAGQERLNGQVEQGLIRKTLDNLQQHHLAILERKLETLLQECEDYLRLALVSAEMVESERSALKLQVVGEKGRADEVKLVLRLVARHVSGGTRGDIANRIDAHRAEVEARLRRELKLEFPKWAGSLSHALESFEEWLRRVLCEELTAISNQEGAHFVEPLRRAKRQVFHTLQNFRDQLSQRTVRAFGVPLRTTEVAIEVEEPRGPDIRVGRVFDRNWELLSAVTPMRLVKRVVERHFEGRLSDKIEVNFSRLASQWEERVNEAITLVGKGAEMRLDVLIETVERLVESGGGAAPQIRADLESLKCIRDEIAGATTQKNVG
jgi:GTP-binding protein EngB required for normal cell division